MEIVIEKLCAIYSFKKVCVEKIENMIINQVCTYFTNFEPWEAKKKKDFIVEYFGSPTPLKSYMKKKQSPVAPIIYTLFCLVYFIFYRKSNNMQQSMLKKNYGDLGSSLYFIATRKALQGQRRSFPCDFTSIKPLILQKNLTILVARK